MPGIYRSAVLAGGVAIALFAAGVQAATGLRSEDEWLYRGTASYSTATQFWDDDYALRDIGCRSKSAGYSNYLEYGYSYYYTLFGRLPLGYSDCGNDRDIGLSDLKLGVRGRINQYRNDRSWELGVTLPLGDRGPGKARVGCGALGIDGEVSRRDDWSPWLSTGYSAGVNVWEAPLEHQLLGQISASGKLGRHDSRMNWYLGLKGELPLSNRAFDPNAVISDCGTQGKLLAITPQLRYDVTPLLDLNCGVGLALAGEDVSRSRGLYCGFSYLWK